VQTVGFLVVMPLTPRVSSPYPHRVNGTNGMPHPSPAGAIGRQDRDPLAPSACWIVSLPDGYCVFYWCQLSIFLEIFRYVWEDWLWTAVIPLGARPV
jgi:hypothetical protein